MKIKKENVEMAFDFVSSAQPLEHTAVISRSTGDVYYYSEMAGELDDLPEDIDCSDDYVYIPHKNDLDLGQRLVWRFVEKEIPGLYEKVRTLFSRRGAYSRYKAFLEQIDLLEKWYEFENGETRKALREWCLEKKIDTDG